MPHDSRSPDRSTGAAGRPGFTLIELLVAIAITAILVAMILPAVQATREAARRSQCRNHLQRLGLALHLYSDAHGAFPAGTVDRRGPIRSRPEGFHHNWIVAILPQLDLGPLANHVDAAVGMYDEPNRSLQQQAPVLLECPSNPAPETSEHAGAQGAGLSNYAACHHGREAPIDDSNSGAFFLNSQLAPDEFPDGLSSTLFLGEVLRDPALLGWGSGTRATLRNTGAPLNIALVLKRASQARQLRDEDAADGVDGDGEGQSGGQLAAGEPWSVENDASDDDDGGDSEDSAPNTPHETPAPEPPLATNEAVDVGGFASHHSGIVHVLLGDGAVRALSEQCSREVLRRLGDRADGYAPVEF